MVLDAIMSTHLGFSDSGINRIIATIKKAENIMSLNSFSVFNNDIGTHRMYSQTLSCNYLHHIILTYPHLSRNANIYPCGYCVNHIIMLFLIHISQCSIH